MFSWEMYNVEKYMEKQYDYLINKAGFNKETINLINNQYMLSGVPNNPEKIKLFMDYKAAVKKFDMELENEKNKKK